MNKSILRNMTWEDVREIRTTNPSGMFATDEQFHKAVLASLRDKHRVLSPIEERFPVVLIAAEQATSWFLTDSRERENTLIRQFVAYRLHNEGYSYSEIGKMLKRDHSTVTNLVHRMRDMLSLPVMYRQEVQQFKRFEELL